MRNTDILVASLAFAIPGGLVTACAALIFWGAPWLAVIGYCVGGAVVLALSATKIVQRLDRPHD